MKDTSQKLDQARRIICARCGAAFTCDLSGHCWCAEETVKLPMPREGGDCLCPACLRASAHGLDQPKP